MAWKTFGAYDTKAKKLAQVTKFTDYDVKTIDSGAGAIVFEQAGYIHELDPEERHVNMSSTLPRPAIFPG